MLTSFTTPTGITVKFTGRHAVLHLPAEVDLTNYEDLRTCAQRLLDVGVPAMILDLTGCRFCDSTTVDAILRTYLHAGVRNTPLTLRLPPSGIVRRVCAITGVTRIVPLEEAEAADGRVPRCRLRSAGGRFRR
ncbi:anti-sigma factor antagonist [Actinomadura sp. KC216]|nr:anti-sigma factor antagonist [Actinomadura sp. KC216]